MWPGSNWQSYPSHIGHRRNAAKKRATYGTPRGYQIGADHDKDADHSWCYPRISRPALDDTIELDNRHNVQGNEVYQIGVQRIVTIPMVANQEYFIRDIRGQQLQVWNNPPSSLYCEY